MAQFSTIAVTDAIWPEVTGVIAYGAAEIGAAWADTYFAKGDLIKQCVTYGSLASGIALVGMRKNVDFGKGLVFGSGVGLLLQVLQMFYDSITGVSAGVKPKFGAVIASRSYGRIGAPKTAPQITAGSRASYATGSRVMARGTL